MESAKHERRSRQEYRRRRRAERRERRVEEVHANREREREELKLEITKRLGVSPNAMVFFVKKINPPLKPKPLHLDHGEVVILDAEDHTLIAVVRFNNFETMTPSDFKSFDKSISTLYQHGVARAEVTNNATIRGVPKHGSMRVFGWRPSAGIKTERGYKAGE